MRVVVASLPIYVRACHLSGQTSHMIPLLVWTKKYLWLAKTLALSSPPRFQDSITPFFPHIYRTPTLCAQAALQVQKKITRGWVAHGWRMSQNLWKGSGSKPHLVECKQAKSILSPHCSKECKKMIIINNSNPVTQSTQNRFCIASTSEHKQIKAGTPSLSWENCLRWVYGISKFLLHLQIGLGRVSLTKNELFWQILGHG